MMAIITHSCHCMVQAEQSHPPTLVDSHSWQLDLFQPHAFMPLKDLYLELAAVWIITLIGWNSIQTTIVRSNKNIFVLGQEKQQLSFD
jgi:hypothetical protein